MSQLINEKESGTNDAGNIRIASLGGSDRVIDESTKIVRYMKLETFLLLATKGRVFIPSYRTLSRIDPLETGLLFNFAISALSGLRFRTT